MAREAVSSQGRPRGTGKRNIEIKKIEKKEQRYVTFSKRRQGLFRKMNEYRKLTGFFFAVVVFSPSGTLFSDGDPEVIAKYRKFIKKKEEVQEDENKEEVQEEENKDKQNLKQWLRNVQLEDYDDIEKLDALKAKLREIKEKVAKKLKDNAA